MTLTAAAHAGFMALVEAYKLRMAGAPHMPSDEQLLSYLVDAVRGANGTQSSLPLALDEVPGVVQLPPSVLMALLRAVLDGQATKQQLEVAEAEANDAWGGICEASLIMSNPRLGSPAQRQAMALKRLGLVREPHGKGRSNPRYGEAADRYYQLRTGGHHHVNGELINANKMTHDEAVSVICDEFRIDWETLVRTWNRYGIEVSTKAQAYDEEQGS